MQALIDNIRQNSHLGGQIKNQIYNNGDSNDTQHDGDVAVISQTDMAFVPMYAVVMYNDDYTTMDFVMHMLTTILNLSVEVAYDLMLTIHHQGSAKVGLFPKEIAETKVALINQKAQQAEYPLLTTIELEG